MTAEPPEVQLAGFLAKYTPTIVAAAVESRSKLRTLLPGALELVYDNYNALVIGYGPTERTSDAILSLVMYPRWVTLYFLGGAALADPLDLLQGSGNVGRNITLKGPADLDAPAIQDLIAAAVDHAPELVVDDSRHRLIIKSISATQRPRRPAG
jgi:hypothetical protein